MVFVCVSIRTPEKVVKPWFARTMLYGTRTLSDIFAEFSSGEFDQGDPIDDKYQTTQVSTNIFQYKTSCQGQLSERFCIFHNVSSIILPFVICHDQSG